MPSHPPVPIQRQRPSALVVDREPPVRSLVKSILSSAGFRVAETEDGRQALSLLKDEPSFDLLVTETQPPELDGILLEDSFRIACPLGRVILTSHSDQEAAAAANTESTGTSRFLPRRHLAQRLIGAVREIGFAQPNRVVLVAEDEPVVRDLIGAVLSKAGYTVMAAVDGEEALNLSRTCPGHIDALISDIKMPRMSGPELAEHIRRERPETRILLMSGYSSGVLRDYATKNNFIPKPFVPKGLIEKVRELLERPAKPGEAPGVPEVW